MGTLVYYNRETGYGTVDLHKPLNYISLDLTSEPDAKK